ncbi:MAG TPA: tRNA lysidine(34) synthetase TilS [Thermoanaerobaculia bacterium]|nr:tRNA lysidine(34) synthetase TilS [Thermoanaerobaculia bacterium]
MHLPSILERFFRQTASLSPLAAGDRILVAFSGGPDSTALLLGFSQLSRQLPLEILAVHLDHGLDPGSAGRAAAAAGLAGRLGVPFVAFRREIPALRHPGESLEVAGRRVRYDLFATLRAETGARYVATAHHRDDQAETVLLRLLFGSGLAGLAAIQPVSPSTGVVRPLLDVPRQALAAAVAAAGLSPVDDPTNGDLSLPRNRLRHQLLPALATADPDLPERLARLAARAAGARRRIEERLEEVLAPRVDPSGVSIERRGFEQLPESLRRFALGALHRRAGAPYPASAAARAELLRQLLAPHAVGCDCGGGWRWEGRRDGRTRRLALRRAPGFTYTLRMSSDRAGSTEVKTDGA